MSYNDCILHGSLGINQCCDVKPTDHYQALYSMNTYPSIEILNRAIESKKLNTFSLGIIGTAFQDFYNNWFPRISTSFVLVINGCDNDFPDQYFKNIKDFPDFISSEKVKHIFAQNCIISHPKITKIPIGLDYHTLANASSWWGPCQTPVEQEQALLNLKCKAKPFWERKPLCYSNFHFFFGSNHGNDRRDALSDTPKQVTFYEPTRKPRLDSWTSQIEFAFVLSPHGNGLDCHRTWEALNLGCIAIVKSSQIDDLYDNLPVLIVDSWSDINAQLLHRTIELFRNRTFDLQKLELKYWKNRIRSFCS